MLGSSDVLNLIEDKQIIKNIISEYLAKTPLLTWQYEDALKILFDRNLRFQPSEDNLKTLGDIYIEEVQKAFQARNNVDDGSEEKEKIESLSQCIYEICAATRIKKLVKIAQYSTQFIEEVEMNTLEMNNFNSEAPADTARHDLSQFVNMTTVDKMKYLCDEYGEEGKFDFTSDKISKRYQPFVSGLKRELDLDLQPLATSKEREMLISISKCKNKDDIDDYWKSFTKTETWIVCANT